MKKIVLFLMALLPMVTLAQDPVVLEDKSLLVNRIFVDGYYKMSEDSLMNVFLPQIRKERDSLIVRHEPHIGEQHAIRYYYGQALFSLSESMIQSYRRDQLWKRLGDAIFSETPIPGLEEVEKSDAAGLFLDSYMRHQLRELFLQAREKQDQGDLFMETQLGWPVDSLKALAGQQGDSALGLLYAKKCLSTELTGYYLSRQFSKQIDQKNLGLAGIILKELKSHFPGHPSIQNAEQGIAGLQQILTSNAQNPDIVFVPDEGSIRSVADLIAPYAGKVIYLDFWGTWCGPCVQEMIHHTPSLKERFKSEEDIIFLYMAMERPADHQKWKEFILLHNLSGYHVTMTGTEIEPFWVELLDTRDVPRAYPTYMIFDRQGNLVTNNAFRPSHGEALYLQLEEVLKK